jgi:hypothetical protein
VKHEPASRLDRAAVVDRAVGRLARVDVELAQEAAQADPGALVADADPDRAIFVMDAHRDHRPLEARVGHSRHRQQQLAGQETRLLDHRNDNETPARGEQGLRRLSAGPICRFA